jgi:hypothetical protein
MGCIILSVDYSIFESQLNKFIVNFKSLLYFALVIVSIRLMENLYCWNQVRLRKLSLDRRLQTIEMHNQGKSLQLLFLLLLIK